MAAYLTLDEYVTPSLALSANDIAALEGARPGLIAARLAYRSAWIASRLSKRYAPLTAPYSPVVTGWLSDLVTLDLMLARGFNPGSEQDQLIVKAADDAKAEIKEAADAELGLFDLPLAANVTATGIVRGVPIAKSSPSPYGWMDQQRRAIRGCR